MCRPFPLPFFLLLVLSSRSWFRRRLSDSDLAASWAALPSGATLCRAALWPCAALWRATAHCALLRPECVRLAAGHAL